jgi:hypothetical protein
LKSRIFTLSLFGGWAILFANVDGKMRLNLAAGVWVMEGQANTFSDAESLGNLGML